MYKNKYVSVIIAAAGMSNRMGSKMNKQFLAVGGKPILAHTIEKFENSKFIDEIILVSKEGETEYCRKEIIKKYKFEKVSKIIKGGKERQDSIYNGLLALNEKTEIVLTHDGARPFISKENIRDGIKEVFKTGSCVVGVPVKDTIKIVGEDKNIEHTPPRATIWAAQTPQCFPREVIVKAYEKAIKEGYLGTDDSSLVERLGHRVKMIMGSYENIKITTPEDLVLAESLFKEKDMIYDRIEFLSKTR